MTISTFWLMTYLIITPIKNTDSYKPETKMITFKTRVSMEQFYQSLANNSYANCYNVEVRDGVYHRMDKVECKP